MDYKNTPAPETLSEIEKTLRFVRKHGKHLIEKPGDTKWTLGNTIFVFGDDKPGMYSYMIGALKNGAVTWHMMPMYGVEEMKQKWASALQPFVSGKSCIQFKKFEDLPLEAITDIVENGTPLFYEEMQKYYAKRAKK